MSIEHDDDEVEAPARPAYPFNPWGFAYEVTMFLSASAEVVSTFLGRVAQDFASHNNHSIEERRAKTERRLLMDDIKSFERGDLP